MWLIQKDISYFCSRISEYHVFSITSKIVLVLGCSLFNGYFTKDEIDKNMKELLFYGPSTTMVILSTKAWTKPQAGF